MHPTGEARADATLKVLIRHLVLSFPQAAILSRSAGGRYYVCVIVPYDGGVEKAIQIERAWLAERATLEEFQQVLEHLNLPAILQTCERYELRLARGSAPANEGWPMSESDGRVAHGPVHLSDSFLPTAAHPLFAVRPD
jgi:hypothetical protein